MKSLRQSGCAKQICDALEVVSHRREADFGSYARQPKHQQTRVAEDTVSDRCEWMLNRASTRHRLWRQTLLHPVQRFLTQVASLSTSATSNEYWSLTQ
jgi:hypothetical protein